MRSGARPSRTPARRGSVPWRTALASVAAAACVVAAGAGSSSSLGAAAPGQPASTAFTGQARGTEAVLAAFTGPLPSAFSSFVPPASQLAAELGGSVDVGPSWTELAPRAARSGERMVRQLSADVLRDRAPADIPSSALGIPGPVLAAYHRAADDLARTDPSCGVSWWLLAGIGRIESGHASGGRVDSNGTTIGRILGPRLDGSLAGNAVIHDSDGGVFDGDPHYDRAVGPMQFLPGTWAGVRSDGNGDGVTDPNNVYDATLGAARYLCQGGADLRTPSGLASAVLRYNNSMAYVRSVLSWGQAYRDGAVAPTASLPGRVPPSVTPRQAPDEPPQRATQPRRHSAAESGSHPSTPAKKSPAKQSPAKPAPPVLADGPRSQGGSGRSTSPEPSAARTPSPSSTVAPGGSDGSSDTGTGPRPSDTTDPQSPSTSSGDKDATPSPGTSTSDTTPPPGSSTTTPPATDTPTTPIPTPTVATAGKSEVWVLDAAPSQRLEDPVELKTPAGTYTVEHRVLDAGATVDRGGEATEAADGERLWVTKVQTPEGSQATVSLQATGGKPVPIEGTGTHYLAASVPQDGTLTLTVTTDDGTWALDATTGVTTPSWAHTATVPADASDARATDGSYTATVQGLQLLQAHRTTWQPDYGAAPQGSEWLVVPYQLTAADITPQGYAESTWASSGLSATTHSGVVPAVLSDGTTPATLTSGGGVLVFRVPAGTTSATIDVTPQVTVVKDGAAPSEKPLALAPDLTADLRFD